MRTISIIAATGLVLSVATGQASGANVTTNEFPHADIVTLLDETKVDVAADGSFSALRHVRTKIVTARGRRAAETVVPFNEKHQQLEFHYAKATAADGSVVELKPEAVETVNVFPGNPAYGEVRAARYRVGGAEVGATVEQEYVLKSKPLMGDEFWMIWRPRSAQPVLEARLELRMPSGKTFQWKPHNAELKPTVAESADKKWKTTTWTYSAPTELRGEIYMPPADEVLPWIEITTVGSWEAIAKWLDELSRKALDSNGDLGKRVQALTTGHARASDKLAAIFYWLEDNIRFVAVELGVSAYRPRSASQVLGSRYGDAKDLCVLLAAMLRDAGIPARLAFLESGTARKISDRLPVPRHLTHCIVVAEADGRTFYLDPTSETMRADVVLGRVCNTELLLLGKDANRLVPSPTYDGSKHGTRERAKIEVLADGSVKGELQVEYLGESDAFIRAAIKSVNAEQARLLMEQDVKKSLPDARVLEYDIADTSDRTQNFKTRVKFEAPAWAEVTGGELRFKPQLPQDINVTNQWSGAAERKLPIQFFETALSSSEVEVVLPAGFVVGSVPKDVASDTPYAHWKRTIRQEGQRLLVSESSHLKTVRLPKESVTDIQKYYDESIARKNDLVVLKKK